MAIATIDLNLLPCLGKLALFESSLLGCQTIVHIAAVPRLPEIGTYQRPREALFC